MNVLKKTRNGLVTYDKSNDISVSLDTYGEYAEHEIQVFKQIIKTGNLILDINADIGYHSICFSRMTGENGTVLSFESNSDNYMKLVSNIALNSLSNVYPSKLSFDTDEFSIDQLGIQSCKLIRINSNTPEQTLQGSIKTLQKCKPVLYLHTLDEDTKTLLTEINYYTKKLEINLFNPNNYFGEENITNETVAERFVCCQNESSSFEIINKIL